MRRKMDNMLIRCRSGAKRFLDEEKGSHIVEIIVVIVILIAVASVFRVQLEGAVIAAFQSLTNFVNTGL